jgi:(4S)-4-hydroxy-5-phosphonooxypentane-2,3-dione isomerase
VSDEAVLVVALWRAADANAGKVRAILRDLAERTAAEPGCLSFEVLEATDGSGSFVLVERYAGVDGHQNHLATGHFRELVLQRAVPLLEHRDVRTYEPLRTNGEGADHERP